MRNPFLKICCFKQHFQYLTTITSTLTILINGMVSGWPSPSLPKLLMTDKQRYWLAVIPFLGGVVGTIVVGLAADKLGRKRIIVLSTFPYFACWIVIAFSKSFLILCIARFVAGIANGWTYTGVLIYIGEISEPEVRSLLEAIASVSLVLGNFLINIIGSYLSIKAAALVSSLVPVISLLTFVWMPESPYYLVMRNKVDAAKATLQILRGSDDVEEVFVKLSSEVKQSLVKGNLLDLFLVKKNRKALRNSFIRRTVRRVRGMVAFTFYAQTIFAEIGQDISPQLCSNIFFGVELVTSIVCCVLVSKVGRKLLLLISETGCGILLFVEGTYFYLRTNTDFDVSKYSYVAVIALMGYVLFYSFGLDTLPITTLSRLFPTNVKAFGLCLTDIYNYLLAVAVSELFHKTKDSLGVYISFYLLSMCCGLGLITIVIYLPDS